MSHSMLGWAFLIGAYCMMWPGLTHEAIMLKTIGGPPEGERKSTFETVKFLWEQGEDNPGFYIPAAILFIFSVSMPFILRRRANA